MFWGEVRRHAAELAALAPDVILALGSSAVGPLLPVTRTVRIVFPVAVDPVGAGFVDSLAQPGGNATGFGAHTSVANKILPSRMQLDLNDVTLNQWGPKFEPG